MWGEGGGGHWGCLYNASSLGCLQNSDISLEIRIKWTVSRKLPLDIPCSDCPPKPSTCTRPQIRAMLCYLHPPCLRKSSPYPLGARVIGGTPTTCQMKEQIAPSVGPLLLLPLCLAAPHPACKWYLCV